MKQKILILLQVFMFVQVSISGQNNIESPFDIVYDYVDNAHEYISCNPYVDFVFGREDAGSGKSGFIIEVLPHPEYVGLSSRNFRVWIDAVQWNNKTYTYLPLFRNVRESNGQTVHDDGNYIDVRRTNSSKFALFISDLRVLQYVPELYDEQKGKKYRPFYINAYFASADYSKYDILHGGAARACGKAATSSLAIFFGEPSFLSVNVDYTSDPAEYMKEHTEYSYFKNSDLYLPGFFLHIQFTHEDLLESRLKDNNYIIISFYKDKYHSDPLTVSCMKDDLSIGGYAMDQNRMEERFNYVAYPHTKNKKISLFVPWTVVAWWWQIGKKATADDYMQTVYYTLTISNDGVTSCSNKPAEWQGSLSIETEVPKEHKKNVCVHDAPHKLSVNYELVTLNNIDGCEQVWKKSKFIPSCTKCWTTLWDEIRIVYDIVDNRCLNHKWKEIGKKYIGERIVVIDDNSKKYYKVWLITCVCQNNCCGAKKEYYQYDPEDEPIDPVNEPDGPCNHEWMITKPEKNGEICEKRGNCYDFYNIMKGAKRCVKCGKEIELKPWREYDHTDCDSITLPPLPCPPHDWVYYSIRKRGLPEEIPFEKSFPAYIDDSLYIEQQISLVRLGEFDEVKGNKYAISEPVTRRLWLTLNADNNYIGFSSDDDAYLTGITYQEASDFIQQLNQMANDSLNLNMSFSMPSADEMRQLLSLGLYSQVIESEMQEISSFFVDSIAVYDGNKRLLTDEQLSTAPEGAKVRVDVAVMDVNGEIRMTDIKAADKSTALVLVATPFMLLSRQSTTIPGRIHYDYWRKCGKCSKEERISENIFIDGRYHKTLVKD